MLRSAHRHPTSGETAIVPQFPGPEIRGRETDVGLWSVSWSAAGHSVRLHKLAYHPPEKESVQTYKPARTLNWHTKIGCGKITPDFDFFPALRSVFKNFATEYAGVQDSSLRVGKTPAGYSQPLYGQELAS